MTIPETTKQSAASERSPTLLRAGPGDRVAELEILLDGGPLCVAGVWDWNEARRVPGLYFVYFKRFGLRFGPYYANIGLAAKDMKKALKAFSAGFWDQALDWYRRQESFHQWVERNMGKIEDLIGGEWIREEKTKT